MKYLLSSFLRPKGKWSFISKLKRNAKILDVGCGCACVIGVKSLLPSANYFGIDIDDYGQNEYSKSLIDNYIFTSPQNFPQKILDINGEFDAVISSHNLEHCNDREAVLNSMLKKVKKDGQIFISFPTEKSIEFPNRPALNYYSDKTHKYKPPKSSYIIEKLLDNNFKITFYRKRYRPILFFILGMITEPFSALFKKVLIGTWELYGLETIIHAKKLT